MRICPRLASGDARDRLYGRLPYEIKQGLRAIARKEKQSISWTVEQVIIRYFHLGEPEYVESKQRARKVSRIVRSTKVNRGHNKKSKAA